MPGVTVLVVARDASSTIARALESALTEAPTRLLVVDDASRDDTAPVARRLGAEVVVLPEAVSLGAARQAALERVRTPFAVWLDADDELLPGRVSRLVGTLEAERADIVADEVELVEHGRPDVCRHLPIPAFLSRPPGVWRLFERNYLPAPGPVGFRVDAVASLGYDPALHGAEDMDLLLRALATRRRLALVRVPGYRVHARPLSVSRDERNQRAMYARALAIHGYEDVERRLIHAGASTRQAVWALVSMATFRLEWATALALAERAAALVTDPDEVLEPDGPCPRPEGWRIAFTRGVLLLELGRIDEAVTALERAERLIETAEGANNLGVGLALVGDRAGARSCFERAAAMAPDYLDAQRNLASPAPRSITTHPLRQHLVRRDYPVEPLPSAQP